MHLLIPFASALAEAGASTLRSLDLPNLARLLSRLQPGPRLGTDEFSLSPPHECALAAAWGWHGGEGRLPFAAHGAAADGIEVLDLAWGLLSPVHWVVGRDRINLADPDRLGLAADESRALFDAVRGLFESEGFSLAWGAPQRWYLAHESLADLPTASLDRVVGRNVDRWLPEGAPARLLRRLFNEAQMLLYTHPLNSAREERGLPSVNALWLSGCGRFQPAREQAVTLDARLRTPLLSEDWPAWAEAWRSLDAGPLADLLHALERGTPEVALTLAGERFAQRFEPATGPLWQRLVQRWRGVAPAPLLEAL
ncbi:hypothetical protein [Piscinibacter defluvii]|uniref:hypothetical protein n=1 Tax=Piscinibacter defluvii TaxID=1796922 RepID=UPI000FDDB972|nr:hypothetical protein [Piscinibacter defluvii]